MNYVKIIWLNMICKLNCGKFANKGEIGLKKLNFLAFAVPRAFYLSVAVESYNLKILMCIYLNLKLKIVFIVI